MGECRLDAVTHRSAPSLGPSIKYMLLDWVSGAAHKTSRKRSR